RLSRSAAAAAMSRVDSQRGWWASIWPMQPRSSPADRRVTKTAPFSRRGPFGFLRFGRSSPLAAAATASRARPRSVFRSSSESTPPSLASGALLLRGFRGLHRAGRRDGRALDDEDLDAAGDAVALGRLRAVALDRRELALAQALVHQLAHDRGRAA